MTIVFKVSDNIKEEMIKYYQDKKRSKTPPYAIFQADEADTNITLYESGKVVFQGLSADIDANMWKDLERSWNNRDINAEETKKEDKKNEEKDTRFIGVPTIGSDEVGTGDYFGPIVVTACYVNKENKDFLEELGVRDSKKLTDEKILEIVPKIVRVIPYNTVILNNKEYNSRYSSNINMNAIKAIMHNKVLSNISKEHNDFEYAVVDQFTYPNAYFSYLKNCSNIFRNITFLTKAEDQVLSVACASIISRYVFIKEMAKISKELGILIPKGASTAVDEVALKIASEKGFDVLTNYVKLNFKNTEKVKELLKNA